MFVEKHADLPQQPTLFSIHPLREEKAPQDKEPPKADPLMQRLNVLQALPERERMAAMSHMLRGVKVK